MGEDNKIVIIGIGNLLLMDEGVGIHVIDELGRHELPKMLRFLMEEREDLNSSTLWLGQKK